MSQILSVRGLRVTFRTDAGKVYAVRDVSFDVGRGETLAIVGESGSGKSVTSKAVMGILPKNASVDAGEIIYGGTDLTKLSERELCRIRGSHIAMVFQDPMSSLDPIMRVGRQITEAMFAGSDKSSRKGRREAHRRAVELMREVGIPDPEKRYGMYPFELSGGMRQRAVIATALASDPELIICDEPTTALDVTVQAQILELLNRLKRERKLSLVFITHDLGVVANVADRVAVMYAGKIVETGTVNEVFYSPAHPYTWALLSSVPDAATRGRLEAIPGSPPDMTVMPTGDAFAPRNPYALEIDYEEEPPMFEITKTHKAATWLLHSDAPRVGIPHSVRRRASGNKENGGEEYGGRQTASEG